MCTNCNPVEGAIVGIESRIARIGDRGLMGMEVLTTSTATEQLGKYIKSKHISKKHISDATGVSVYTLYTAFGNARVRQLNANEFLIICRYLEVNPFDFLDDAQKGCEEGADL